MCVNSRWNVDAHQCRSAIEKGKNVQFVNYLTPKGPAMVVTRRAVRRFCAIAIASVPVSISAIAHADEASDRAAGAAVAKELCSGCHVVTEGQAGPVPDGVPPGVDVVVGSGILGWLPSSAGGPQATKSSRGAKTRMPKQ